MKKTITYSILALLFFNCGHSKSFYSIVDIPDNLQKSNCHLSTNEPLHPYPLLQLPLGSIQAKGWLETQLNLMTEGYTGHLYEISRFLDEKSGWPWFIRNMWKASPDNGLVMDDLNINEDILVKMSETIPDQPWDEQHVPIVVEIPAKKITGWKASVNNTVDPLREGPILSDEPIERIEMIPMGAAHLRLTCLPVISEGKNARYWEHIPDPNNFMLERLTQ